jgi:hypothetical protein
MSWHILMLAALAILIITCAKLVKEIRRAIDDEDLEYYSKWQ